MTAPEYAKRIVTQVHRQIRIERRSILLLADGSTLTLDPGLYSVHVDDKRAEIWWSISGKKHRAAIDRDEIGRHLARRNLVYVSW